MNSIQKLILKTKFRFMIWKMKFKKQEIEVDKSEGFIYEADED
jgi:hypothetical protein